MHCACGFEAASEFAFCPKCGSKLSSTCVSCGFASPPEFAFCPKCGARLDGATAASGSGQAAPSWISKGIPGLPSADERLAALQRLMPDTLVDELRTAAVRTTEGERRPVTVLFADLSGFTALSEALDIEETAALVDRCLRAMAESIYRYQGTVDKYIGDAVMALFGAPVAHEDDPERAIRAALDMRERIAAIRAELGQHADGMAASRTPGTATEPVLSLHVGINTGVVLAGPVGSDRRREYTVLGDAVNVAARLETAARNGEVIVGEPTYRLARHAVAFEPLGELSLKGKAEPLPAYRVLGLLAEPRSSRGLEAHALTAPLIGRDDELGQLMTAFDRMLSDRTQVVSLIGEAGAGKSRLIRELLGRLGSEGRLASARVTIRRAVCSSLGEEAYGLLAAIFRDAWGIDPDDPGALVQEKISSGLAALEQDPETIALAAPLIGHVLGVEYADPRLRYIEPEQLKRQLFLVVRELFERRLQQGPFLLVVEDLHWADAASLELLRFVVDRLGDRQLMLLLAHRPTFDLGALFGMRAGYTAIRLAPLSFDESGALLAALFGASAGRIPAPLRELIVGRAGGNPFYLEEVVRSLIEAGALIREADGWTCRADLATIDVPPTVQGVLLARLDTLPPRTRRLAQEAAVLGSTFEARLLRSVCTEPDAVEIDLHVLRDAGLVAETRAVAPERRYAFLHVLVQEVAYQSLLVRRRTELHGRAGMALEQLSGDQPRRLEDLEALGHHYSLGTEKVKGARYLTMAGDWARAIYANEDAARYYRRALEILRTSDSDDGRAERLATRERLGDVLGPAGQRDEALEQYEAALQAYELADCWPDQARLQRKVGVLHWAAGDRTRALARYQAGLALLDGRVEHIELAYLYQEMGRLAFRSGDSERAIDWAERARALAERLATTAPLTEARKEAIAALAEADNTLGAALARTGRLEEAVACVERSAALAREHELPQVACRAFANLGVLYSTLDPGRAIETCLTGLELAKKIGDLGLQPWLYANLAGAYCTFTGQCEEEGIIAARAAIDLDRQLGQLDHLAVPLIVLGQIYQCHGEPESALQCYQEALSLAEEIREPQLLFPCYDGLATLYLELGDEAEAERHMVRGQEICEQAGLDIDSLVVLPFLS
jgi:adenylate cyclase